MLNLLLLLVGAGALAGGVAIVVTLVDSPTRLDRPRRVGTVGDTIDIIETLRGADGSPQDLTGATVTFTLDDPNGGPLIVAQPATILQSGSSNLGRVKYRIGARTAVPAGENRWKFKASWDADTALSFPDDNSATLTMYAAP